MQCELCVRPGIMLVLAMLLVACAGAHARNFNVTYFFVPHIVAPDQHEAKIDCQYDADFTLLSFFKDSNEFFRYRPADTPSARTFPILGIGSVEMLLCGPIVCQLKLLGLTKDATGLYRCDIERDLPPYKYANMKGYMEVLDKPLRKPSLEALAEEYKEGEIIEAYCRGSPNSELRWYINGVELKEFRGSSTIKKKNSILLYRGLSHKMLVQCVEFRHGRAYGSTEQEVTWWDGIGMRKKKEHVEKNGSIAITGCLGLLSILCLLDKVFYV